MDLGLIIGWCNMRLRASGPVEALIMPARTSWVASFFELWSFFVRELRARVGLVRLESLQNQWEGKLGDYRKDYD